MAVTDVEGNDENNFYTPRVEHTSPLQFLDYTNIWQPAKNARPMPHSFRGDHGLTVDTAGFHPRDYFRLFVTEDLLTYFVAETNLFALQYLRDYPKTYKKAFGDALLNEKYEEYRQARSANKPCTSNPCQNGGSYINIFFGFQCKCGINYFGRKCVSAVSKASGSIRLVGQLENSMQGL
ncbi:uncharacterized protein TRIADDRAFT_62398 [Trichoplax adhaerens]|uniref:EGF-like domain-containing protein n=1 Tax=Trichoplax adhaerens TaxID=10228 RepID=B3SDP0_TRIAD|nr:predicted protein [Trichoplax adhaerens]EDV19148.1 predicted protein [Trichoplax adhaerens]|eukprot:XP_002118359.1 predicted protein [Trichoplax adhaerens]